MTEVQFDTVMELGGKMLTVLQSMDARLQNVEKNTAGLLEIADKQTEAINTLAQRVEALEDKVA